MECDMLVDITDRLKEEKDIKFATLRISGISNYGDTSNVFVEYDYEDPSEGDTEEDTIQLSELFSDLDSIIGKNDTFVSVVFKPQVIVVIESSELGLRMELSGIDRADASKFVDCGRLMNSIDRESNLIRYQLIIARVGSKTEETATDTEDTKFVPSFEKPKDTTSMWLKNFGGDTPEKKKQTIVWDSEQLKAAESELTPAGKMLSEKLKAAMLATKEYMDEPVTDKTTVVNDHPYEPDIPNVDPSNYVSEEENRSAMEEASEQAKKEHLTNVALTDALLNSDIEMDNSDFEEDKE